MFKITALDLMAMFEEHEAANQEQPGAGEEGTFATPPVNPILPLPRAPKRPKVTKPAGERCEKGKKEPVRRKLVFNTPHKIKSVCFIGCPTRRQSKGNFYQRLEIVEELADGTEKEIITSVDRIPEYLAVLRTENYEVYCKFISNLF